MIRTKIIATIGPATAEQKTLAKLIRAGCDVFRVNFSHGSAEGRQELLNAIRSAECDAGEPVAVLADLCGPKIRVGPIAGGSVLLGEGQEICIHSEPILGGAGGFSTTLVELPRCLTPGEPILLDDGKIRLRAGQATSDGVICTVVTGGVLSDGKGVNLPETDLPLSALTEKDRRDAEWIAQRDFDYVALSFVRSAGDIEELRALLGENDCRLPIIAKIEKPQAMQQIDSILDAADGVMVARGDLGVEMDLPAVPVAQKRIAALAQQKAKPCIIATQMLETMTHQPTPTRAEVSDVANAVLDHADAVMLSGETAVGEYPVQTVELMNRIVSAMQDYQDEKNPPLPPPAPTAATTAAIARAVHEVLATEPIAAVAVYTATGTTARFLSKTRVPLPILALSPDPAVVRRASLYYGVQAFVAGVPEHTTDVLETAAAKAVELKLAKPGQKLVVISGRPLGRPGRTNTLVVHEV